MLTHVHRRTVEPWRGSRSGTSCLNLGLMIAYVIKGLDSSPGGGSELWSLLTDEGWASWNNYLSLL